MNWSIYWRNRRDLTSLKVEKPDRRAVIRWRNEINAGTSHGDALNALDRRSRLYAFDAHGYSEASPAAAVAAAARFVIVYVIDEIPAPFYGGMPSGRHRQRQR